MRAREHGTGRGWTPPGRSVPIVVCLLGTALVGAYRVFSSAPTGAWPTQELLWGVVAAILTAVGCLVVIRSATRLSGRLLLLRCGSVVVIYITITFGLTALVWLREPPERAAAIDPEYVVRATTLLSIVLVAWTVGYLLRAPQFLLEGLGSLTRWTTRSGQMAFRYKNVALWLYAVGSTARLARLAAGRYGYLQDPTVALESPSGTFQLLAMVEVLTLIGLIIGALDAIYISRSIRARLIFFAIFAAEVGLGLFSASKQTVLVALISVGLVYLASGRPVRLAGVGLTVAATLFVFSFNSSYRASIRTSSSQQIGISDALAALPTAVGATVTQPPSELIGTAISETTIRVRQADNVALVMQKTPSLIPYRSSLNLVVGPVLATIPRVLWPGKPVNSTALDFSRQYYNLPTQLFSASAITPVGDLYRHGGVIPVVLGVMLLGALARLLDESLDIRVDTARVALLLPLMFVIAKFENDFTSVLVALVQTFVIGAIAVRVAFVSRGGAADGSAGAVRTGVSAMPAGRH